jgi:uncharacterized membrane protein YphA (DoxX/SURF4 family)
MTKAVGLYDCAMSMVNHLRPVLLLLCRLYIGYGAVVSGWGHLHDVDTMVGRFIEWHIPMPRFNVYFSAYTELICGTLLALGVAARLVAIPFTINFVVAIVSVDLAYPKYRDMLFHIWRDQDFVLKDDAFPFFFVGLMVLIFGPGKYSLDHYVLRPLFHREHREML